MSKAPDRTRDNWRECLDDGLDYDDTSIDRNDRGSCLVPERARTMQTPILSPGARPNKINGMGSDGMKSRICFRDSMAVPTPQSSRIRISAESGSVEHQATAAIKEYFANLLHETSESGSSKPRISAESDSIERQATAAIKEYLANLLHETSESGSSDDESRSPPTSAAFHAKYRKSDPDLMTLHKFTGKMNGRTPIYVPVYKRDKRGKLFRLMESRLGRCEYLELEELREDEVEGGLKILEKPKSQVGLQSAEPKKPVGRRTLAGFALSETEMKGGWK